MAASEKPRHRSGYTLEETEQVRMVCLTVAVTLGAYLDDVCIVGGLVPPLLIDTVRTGGDEEDFHPGTNDLDIALALAVLDEKRYAEISRRLRREDFEPDKNEKGHPTVQRWRYGSLKVTIDFLMPPTADHTPALRVHNLEPDFGALVAPGLELAFDERVPIELDGHTLKGEQVRRKVPVCGPAAFVVLKALAFGDRGEPKDAYDLTYVIRNTGGRGATIAERLRLHAERYGDIVARALGLLKRDFDTPESLGPRRAAAFTVGDDAELENAAADAHGFVDDMLRELARLGLAPAEV